MKLLNIELEVIKKFARENKMPQIEITALLNSVRVSDRTYTGSGFLAEINVSSHTRVDKSGSDYIWNNAFSTLNSKILTGYLIYIKDGYLNTIEGFTFGEDWPEDIYEIEFSNDELPSV